MSLARVDLSTGAVKGETPLSGLARGLAVDGAGIAYTRRWADPQRRSDPQRGTTFFLEGFEPTGARRFSVPTAEWAVPVMALGAQVVLADDSVRSTVDGRVLQNANSNHDTSLRPDEGNGTRGLGPGVGSDGGSRFRLGRSLIDLVGSPSVLLHVDSSGNRVALPSADAVNASELYLTTAAEALCITESLTETRVRQVHAAGLEVMSCPLIDDAPAPGGAEVGRLRLGRATGFTGRVLAAWSIGEDCPVCGRWTPPRLAFYDLGRQAPGVAASGWVGPRGTPGGTQRAR